MVKGRDALQQASYRLVDTSIAFRQRDLSSDRASWPRSLCGTSVRAHVRSIRFPREPSGLSSRGGEVDLADTYCKALSPTPYARWEPSPGPIKGPGLVDVAHKGIR